MKVNLLITLVIVSICQLRVNAQTIDSLFQVPDTARIFSLDNLYQIILENHPVAKQASLLSDVAQQEIRLARGNFDPKIEAALNSKKFDGKTYYEIFNTSLKFPMIFPLDPTIGLDRNKGPYLNPERYVDNEFNYRQLYAGVSIPLGRGLLTDERRTALRQAALFKSMTEAEQVKMLNKLMLDAAKTYWTWYDAYYNYTLLNRSVRISEEIFRRVKTNYDFGEASMVDTIQAKITWQERIIEQQEAHLNFKNAGLELSIMLWDDAGNPAQLQPEWIPALSNEPFDLNDEELRRLTDQAIENHPDLRKIQVKLYQLDAERRLAQEYLKPQLNLSYYAINQPLNPEGNASFQPDDNYKFGVDFSLPLFLRKERSKVALTKLKISNTQFEQTLTERQIINGLSQVYNQLTTIRTIMISQREMVENYSRLLDAELLNLEQGESDLFKINVQQAKLIEAQTKWVKLLSQNEKQKAELYWAAGSFPISRPGQ